MAVIDYLSAGLDRSDRERVGIAGYELLAVVDESVSKTAELPDTFLEDGSNVQQSIILNPLVVTITGEVGDIHLTRSAFNEAFTRISANVGVITQYTPESTGATVQRIEQLAVSISDQLRKVDKVIADGKQIAAFLGNQDAGQNNREKFLDHFDKLYEGKQLISVETAFRRHDSMAIESFITTTNNKSEIISFKIVVKKFQIASTAFVQSSKLFNRPSASTKDQVGGETDQGVQAGEKVTQSLATQIKDFFTSSDEGE